MSSSQKKIKMHVTFFWFKRQFHKAIWINQFDVHEMYKVICVIVMQRGGNGAIRSKDLKLNCY